MALVTHVRKGDWTQLEDEWTELMLGDASIEPVLAALPHAAKRRALPRLLPLLREHAEILEGDGRAEEAAVLLGTAMLAGGSPGELARPLLHCAHGAWGEEPWWEMFTELAGLVERAPDMRAAWRAFRRLNALGEGRAVYHAKGWGIGRIDGLDLDQGEVRVTFQSGRNDRFPLQTAIDIFEVLDPDDPRSMVVTDPEGLARRLAEEPLEILRAVVARNGGEIDHGRLKIAMAQLGAGGARFTTFWRKARKVAETSPWFEVSGSGTRVQVRLLDAESDPAEGLRRQLERSANLGQAMSRVRDLFVGGNLDPLLRDVALESLAGLARRSGEILPHRLAAWMFLRDELGQTPEDLLALLRETAARERPADPNAPPALWAVFQQLPGLREQERCIELLREVYPADWLEEAARHLPHAAPGMVRGLVDALEAAGQGDCLARHYGVLLLRTTRNPSVLVALAERLEAGEPPAGLPGALQRAQCLLQLATHLERLPTADPQARARLRLAGLLARGADPLLPRLLAEAGADDLRRLVPLVDRGVGREIDRMFTRIVVRTAPEVFRADEVPFWEGDGIWTTRAGLTRREEELRLLRDVKIPANAEAIGKAASFGDLSENSEWESAIEEQRTLTSRAAAIEDEMRVAHLIEDAAIPPDTVSPGTKVCYREAQGGEREVSILGPWDTEQEGVISYRSPLAAGLLGLHPGDRAVLTLPRGTLEVEVLGVATLPLS